MLTRQTLYSTSTVDQVQIILTSMTHHAGNLHTGSAFLIDLHLIWPLKPVKPPMGWPEAETHALIDKCMHIHRASVSDACAGGKDLEGC